MALEHLAFLLMPAGNPSSGIFVEAGVRWRFELPPGVDADVVVWGRGPLPFGTSPATAARFSLARERGLGRLRREGWPPWTDVAIHRLPPPLLRAGPVRYAVRSAALGGALVDMSRPGGPPRVIDAVIQAALGDHTPAGSGAGGAPRRFHPGSGGAGLVRLQTEGRPMLIRAAPDGSPPDPSRNADALEALAPLHLPVVPVLHGRGIRCGASWSAEAALPGRRARRVTPAMSALLGSICARLPVTAGPPRAMTDDLSVVAARFPRTAGIVDQAVRGLQDALSSAPSILRHGDLWAGNVLVRGGTVTGVVDWDSWHPRGVPGADLLHFVGMAEGGRRGRSLGETWVHRPWESPTYRRLAEPYWGAIGWEPSSPQRSAVGVAWWACHVANAVMRLPGLAGDERWIERNIDPVARELST